MSRARFLIEFRCWDEGDRGEEGQWLLQIQLTELSETARQIWGLRRCGSRHGAGLRWLETCHFYFALPFSSREGGQISTKMKGSLHWKWCGKWFVDVGMTLLGGQLVKRLEETGRGERSSVKQ